VSGAVTPTRARRRQRRIRFFAGALALLACTSPRDLSGQLSEPCRSVCGLILGSTAVTTATGAAVAVGRLRGGVSTAKEGLLVWGATLGLYAGAGVSLQGNGERQQRAVLAAGIGTLAGSLLALAIESARREPDGAAKFAASLAGAALGAVVGGVYGATTARTPAERTTLPSFSVTVSF